VCGCLAAASYIVDMSKPVIVIATTTAICAVIVIIILLACSYAKVEPNDVALLYSHAARKIDRSKLYTGGRYYVGVGGEFITFPLTLQEMALPVFESRTSDGLKILLEVSLNYKIVKDQKKILALYDHFADEYDGYISRLAMNIVRDASAMFKAFDYSFNRSAVSNEMERMISDDMAEIGFTLESVQLLNIEFPSGFTYTMSQTLVLQQQVNQAKAEKAAELVSLEGELAKASITAAGMISDAMSQATNIEQNAEADASALKFALEQEGASHKSMINMFEAQLESSIPDQTERAKAARDMFVKWFWMNQVSASAASKSIATSVPNGVSA